MRTVRRRIYAAHLTVCRGIIEQLEQVEIDAFPTAFVTSCINTFTYSTSSRLKPFSHANTRRDGTARNLEWSTIDSLQSALFHHGVIRRDPPGERLARPFRTAPLLVGEIEIHAHTEV
jgi:hypothetical protein